MGNSVSGRAEYFNGKIWGTICDDFFNPIAANIFCHSINSYFGFHYLSNIGSLSTSEKIRFMKDKKQILMDDVKCKGNEESIS